MVTFVKKISKTVKNLLTGKDSKRSATVKLPLASAKTMENGKVTEFEDPDSALANALAIAGDSLTLVKWFDHGRISHARVVGSNSLLGASDKDTRKAIKQFATLVEQLMLVMDFSKEEAITKIAAKPQFGKVVEYYRAIEKGSEDVTFDFSLESLATPRWFGGEDESEDEESEEEEK